MPTLPLPSKYLNLNPATRRSRPSPPGPKLSNRLRRRRNMKSISFLNSPTSWTTKSSWKIMKSDRLLLLLRTVSMRSQRMTTGRRTWPKSGTEQPRKKRLPRSQGDRQILTQEVRSLINQMRQACRDNLTRAASRRQRRRNRMTNPSGTSRQLLSEGIRQQRIESLTRLHLKCSETILS